MKLFSVALALGILLSSCSEIKTSDVGAVFKYWSGANPPADIELLDGQYWRSGHWTTEYILYLKFRPTDKWWRQFIKQNALSPATSKWTKPYDAPDWFTPAGSALQFQRTGSDQNCSYFRDTATGVCYVYEEQL